MAAPQDIMTKTNNPSGISTARPKHAERRGCRRCKITQLMRIRPSDPLRDHFEDIHKPIPSGRLLTFIVDGLQANAPWREHFIPNFPQLPTGGPACVP